MVNTTVICIASSDTLACIGRLVKRSRAQRPRAHVDALVGSLLAFAPGDVTADELRNPYPPHYRAAFAFSDFPYPQPHRAALRLSYLFDKECYGLTMFRLSDRMG